MTVIGTLLRSSRRSAIALSVTTIEPRRGRGPLADVDIHFEMNASMTMRGVGPRCCAADVRRDWSEYICMASLYTVDARDRSCKSSM